MAVLRAHKVLDAMWETEWALGNCPTLIWSACRAPSMSVQIFDRVNMPNPALEDMLYEGVDFRRGRRRVCRARG